MRRLDNRLASILGFANMVNDGIEAAVQTDRDRTGRLVKIYGPQLDELDPNLRIIITRLQEWGDARAAYQTFEAIDGWKNGLIDDRPFHDRIDEIHADWRRRTQDDYAAARAPKDNLPNLWDDDDEIGPS